MAPGSDFGSWGVGSLDTHTRGEPQTCSVERSPAIQRRPASATVRVPYLPSHVRIYQTRARRRPRSAASYMRSTFAIDSALPARATSPTTKQPGGRRLRGRASWQPEARPADAKYVLQEDARPGRHGSYDVPTVPRPRQGFGVRMPTAGKKTVVKSRGGEGGRSGGAQTRSAGSDRCPSRRPTSAPARFFGRRLRSSPGCERTAGPEKHDRRGRVPPRRATKRRPGSAQTGNLAHQNGTQGYHLYDQRGDGSPLPPAGWGVRPTSASSTLATSFEAGCLEQAGRTYEEVVVCRGTQRTAKGSVARHQRGQPGRGSAADPEEHRQKDDGFGGRSGKGLGLLDGAGEGQWACGGTIEGGGDSSVVDQKQLGLAINPSPWGAFVGGPPAERETELGGNRKRPSSAPRRPSTTTTIPAPGLEVGSGRRVQARPRSAHAASPSRNLASDVFVTAGYSSCDKEDGSGPKKVRVGAERATQNPARRRFRGGQPVSAVDRAELGEGTPGMDARRPSQADGARVSKSSYQQRAAAPGAGLVVIARQVKRCNQKSGLACKAGERIAAPNCWPSAACGAPSDATSPEWLAQPPPPPAPPPPPPPPTAAAAARTQKVFGLFGSALLPARSRTELSRHWENKRGAPQPRKQDRPRPQGRQQRAPTARVRTTKSGVERRTDGRYSSVNFAPVVLDRRIINAGEQNGRRHVRAAGLVGKALRVPKHTISQSQQQQQQQQGEGQRPFSGLSQGQQPQLPGTQ